VERPADATPSRCQTAAQSLEMVIGHHGSRRSHWARSIALPIKLVPFVAVTEAGNTRR
jgi:hypothetical protein